MRNPFKIFRKIYNYIYKKISPVKFAYKIGVNCNKKTLYIYGNINWSTEPWIIEIGDNVHLTNNVSFITHEGGTLILRQKEKTLDITKPIKIGNNVYIGTNVILLPGITLGKNVIVGSGSVVTKDFPNNVVIAGNPAKIIKSTEEYYNKILIESTKLGHLKGRQKDKALRTYYNYKKGDKK